MIYSQSLYDYTVSGARAKEKLSSPISFACVNVAWQRPHANTASPCVARRVEFINNATKATNKCQNVLFQLSNSICEAYRPVCIVCVRAVYVVLLLCVCCCCVCCCCVCNYAYDYLMTFSFCI